MGACPHYPSRHSFHTPNFRGAIDALVQCIYTINSVGTSSFTLDPSGYAANFEGLVQCIEDLNFTMSGITSGGGGGTTVQAGSGIYFTTSGTATVINATAPAIQAGSGIYLTSSGVATVINATVTSASGAVFTAGSGLYLVNGSQFNINYDNVFQNSVSGHIFGAGDNTVSYSGNTVTISGSGITGGGGGGGGGVSVTVSGGPSAGYGNGSLWFDTNEGRLFVYASGNGVSDPAWYQTNAEALAYKSEVPPSGAGFNAPPRDGSLWFNNLMGSLFVYDATSSGWYETGPSRGLSYSVGAPAASTEGAVWVESGTNLVKVWNGSAWADISIDGGVY
jgi:hypothetical protein